MSSLHNLTVPFNVPIPGGMYTGKMVTVHGTIPPMSQRFAVNLLTRSGDIALHVCPRFKENQVVRNNVLNMNWGPEERHGSMPVYPGQNFEIIIICESYDFKIAFNGCHFTEFSHRLPFNTITSLAVDGQVVVDNVNFKDNTYGNNNNSSNPTSYGFQPVVPPVSSGGLYPGVPSDLNPKSNSGGYPNSGGSLYPQTPSLYPTQPSYSTIPHQGPYPQVPSPHSGGYNPAPQPKPGILDQAGSALAGALGPALLAGAINRKFGSPGYGRTNLVDEAGRALAGVIGGSGVTGSDKSSKGMQPNSPSQSGFLNQAGSALADIVGSGLMGTGRPHRGILPTSPTSRTQPTFLDQAGSALADIVGGGLMGTGRSHRAILPSSPTSHTQPRFLDQAGSALADIVGSGLTGTGHHKHNKLGGILGGTLGTAIAGAALTGHLNPIKAAKKQRKAQKKALKYGLPLAGVGLGAYAVHKGLKGFRRSSSSSSCSSSD